MRKLYYSHFDIHSIYMNVYNNVVKYTMNDVIDYMIEENDIAESLELAVRVTRSQGKKLV